MLKDKKQEAKLKQASAKSQSAESHEQDQAKSAKAASARNNEGTVERIINSLVTTATAACYIGQNGLYQSGSTSKDAESYKKNA